MDQASKPEEKKDEKSEFLKREEVRTMAKDISHLREDESQREREKIAAISPGSEKTSPLIKEFPEFKEEIPPEKRPFGTIIPKPPKRPSSARKILIRTLILIPVVLIIGGAVWFLLFQKEQPSGIVIPPGEEEEEEEISPVLPPAGEEEEEEEKIVEESEIKIPTINERILSWGYYIPTVTRTIDTIIVHAVYNALGGDVHDIEKIIEEFRMYGVTSHYLIAQNGEIYRLAPEEAIAYHAGASRMPDGSRVNIINNFSIGIELIYKETESPNELQYQSLVQFVRYLRQQYNIPFENILGHNQIAPERKTDPWNFDWEYFMSLLK